MRISQLHHCVVASLVLAACGGKSEPQPAPAAPATAEAAPSAPGPSDPGPSATPTVAAAEPTPEPSAKAPAPTTCPLSALVAPGTAGVAVGGLAELARATGLAGATDEEALAALCRGRAAAECNATMTSYVASETVGEDQFRSLYVRRGLAGDGPWIGFPRLIPFVPANAGDSQGRGPDLDGGRYVVVTFHEFDEDAGYTCDPTGEGACELDISVLATYAIDVVIDREAGRHVFTSVNSAFDGETCDAHTAPTFDGGRFVRTDCQGKAQSFSPDEVVACTPAAFAGYATEQAKKVAAARKKAVEARGVAAPVADAAGPKSAAAELADGRKLTSSKQYAEAIAAFSRASDLDGDLLEALSGRCYAKLQRAEGDDVRSALLDCQKALTSVSATKYEDDTKFRGAVAFNIGLAYEKLGLDDDAKTAFENAHEIRPSEATKKKLAKYAGE